MTINDADKRVVGRAVYIEMRLRSDYAQQLLFVPRVKRSDHSSPAGVYFRTVSEYKSRATWRHRHCSMESSASENNLTLRYTAIGNLLSSMMSRGWRLHRSTVVVEVTERDLVDLTLGKTPYKLLTRVMAARKALGFPESLYGNDDPVAVAAATAAT
jgi:hypothetical protein